MKHSPFRIRDFYRRLEMAKARYPGGVAEAWARLGIPVSRLAAELYEAMPERFTLDDVRAAVDDAARHVPDGPCAGLTRDDLLELVGQWRTWEMITLSEAAGATIYTKTGIRPYTMDKGYFTGSQDV